MFVPAGKRDTFVTIQHLEDTREGTYNTGTGGWTKYRDAWAEWQDILPSRAERVAEGINLAKRPARVRTLFIPGVTSAMRIVRKGEIFGIVAGPAVLGRRDGLEMVVEQSSTAGT